MEQNHLFTHVKPVICAVPEPSMAIYQDVPKATVYEYPPSIFSSFNMSFLNIIYCISLLLTVKHKEQNIFHASGSGILSQCLHAAFTRMKSCRLRIYSHLCVLYPFYRRLYNMLYHFDICAHETTACILKKGHSVLTALSVKPLDVLKRDHSLSTFKCENNWIFPLHFNFCKHKTTDYILLRDHRFSTSVSMKPLDVL